jgi:polyisoprenoid-binding protein YceI
MRFLALLPAMVLIAGTAAAAPAWTVDKDASRLGFVVGGDTPFTGTFGRWDAQIAFDPNDLPGSKVQATIDTASAKTGDQTRDEMLPTGDWFSVKDFPQAMFTTRTITAESAGHYVAAGDLKIREVSRPVTLPFTLDIIGDTAKMSGSLTVDRTAFGVGQGQFKTGDMVPLDVKITVDLVAKHAP